MENYKYIRKMIGILIKFYRKKLSIQINDLIDGNNDEYYKNLCLSCNKCSIPKRICSRNTLFRLEEGNLIQNDCIYIRLSEKLNKKVILNEKEIYKKIDSYRNLLLIYLNEFSKSKLEKLEANICNDLNKYENVLYVYEILLLYKQLIQDKLYNFSTNKEDLNLFIFIKDHLKNDDKKLLLYYFYFGSFRYAKLDIDISKVILEVKQYIDDPLFYLAKLDLINENPLLIAHKELLTTEYSRLTELNSYQKYCYYNSLAYIQLNLSSFNESYESLKKCLLIIESSDFGNMLEISCYLQLGFVSYCLDKYSDTVNFILKAFEMNYPISNYLPILCSALLKVEKENKISEILSKIDSSKIKSNYGIRVYTYYKMKYQKRNLCKKDYLELENYICNMLKPLLKVYGEIHYNIFKNELKNIVAITGNYKKFYNFECQ